MEKIVFDSLGLFIPFLKNAAGCIHNPYITYRKLATQKTDIRQTVYIFLFVIIYFLFASLTRMGIGNPYILTIQFNLLVLATLFGFLMTVLFIYYAGKIMKGTGDIQIILLLWSFTLIPTLVWFFVTSVVYIVLPPPRTLSLPGKLFSVIYSAFTISAFLWKIILSYLTLRFGMKLELIRITVISAVFAPLLLGFSVIMYKMGIFRVPFL